MAQTGSSGVFKVGSILLRSGVRIFTGSGAPTNGTSGTGAGKAGPGSLYVRTATGAIYANTNTQASPTWGQLGSVAALAEGSIFVGNAGGAAAAVDASTDGQILVGNGTTLASVAVSGDVTIDNAGVTAIGAKKVVESMIALANHKIFIGDAGGAAAAMAVTGDVTISDAGVTAIGAGKVTNAMVAPAALDGTVAKVVADANIIGGIPVLHRIDAAALTGDVTVVLTHKTRIVDVWCVATAAGGAGDTITVKNVATAITDAMDLNVSDKVVVRAGTIDDAQHEVAAGANLVVTGASGVSAIVYVLGFRVA